MPVRFLAVLASLLAAGLTAPAAAPTAAPHPDGFEFIETGFENASPLWYEADTNGVIQVHLNYDHERASPNRAAGHIHFLLHAKTGTRLTLEFRNLDNVWNGRPGSVAKELKAVVVSGNGRDWKAMDTVSLPEDRIQLALEMPGPRLYVARLEPYRISDLDRLIESIRPDPRVGIETIGKTVEGRALEIVRIGRPDATHRVFIRARAHPWESGGNWVVQGLIRRLLEVDEAARKFLSHGCVYILPMANKDGVARGMTRFNVRGKDLNRNWDKPADAEFAPENAALEAWLDGAVRGGRRPNLALELHNDGSGLLHISRPNVPGLEKYLANMQTFESLLRKHTWFTEGSTKATFHIPGTLGDGWLERFGIEAAVLEFHANWIAGLKDHPSGRHWESLGAGLLPVFEDYFAATEP